MNEIGSKKKFFKKNMMDTPACSKEQLQVVRAVVERGQSVFITGGAGTGKSHTLRVIIAKLRAKFRGLPEGTVAVVAPTGQAALQVDGATIHSWARLNPHAKTIDQVPKIHRDPWRLARVLVIDEVSMVSLELFQLLNDLAQRARDSYEPFGGLQVICCGDFLQLPPIKADFCFKSSAWRATITRTFQLTESYRQAQDPEFVNILKRIRVGDRDAIAPLKRCALRVPARDDIQPTRLYAKRNNVESENEQELHKLSGPLHSYQAQNDHVGDSPKWNPPAPSSPTAETRGPSRPVAQPGRLSRARQRIAGVLLWDFPTVTNLLCALRVVKREHSNALFGNCATPATRTECSPEASSTHWTWRGL
jgi:hypothetical protein